jgi:hypothetical protein
MLLKANRLSELIFFLYIYTSQIILILAILHATCFLVNNSTYQCPVNFEKAADLYLDVLMAISPTDIRILFTNYIQNKTCVVRL